jgi:predicted transposase YbfD/YdcC
MRAVCDREVRGILKHFAAMPDPRSTINQHHLLVDVIVIAMCGVLAGADGPAAIERWAVLHETWLRNHLRLPEGIPSHDTIGRVLQRLQPQAFQECFTAWLKMLQETPRENQDGGTQRPHYAVDGKTMRRSHDSRRQLGPLHLVSAWATEQGLTLGQVATEEKSNEITAIPRLLSRLDLQGAIITIDAAGCQKNIAEQIIHNGGDYVLALKGNQETLYRAVLDYWGDHLEDDFARVRVSRLETEERSHGRREHRTYYQLNLPAELAGSKAWSGLRTLGMATRISQYKDREACEVRYYISSLKRNVRQFARVGRKHWAIENTLHWSLDMTFREDESRARHRGLAENLAWLRRFTLSLLKQHPGKESLVMKRRMAGWSVDYLMQILTTTAC